MVQVVMYLKIGMFEGFDCVVKHYFGVDISVAGRLGVYVMSASDGGKILWESSQVFIKHSIQKLN